MIELDYLLVTQPIGDFYLTSIKASVLLPLVGVERRSSSPSGIQRDLSKERVKEIAEYCKDPDATFPTSIIINILSEYVNIDFERKKIIIDNTQNSIVGHIIDGQHRLFGISESDNLEDFYLPVVIMFDLTQEQQAYVFSIINSKQTKVTKSLIYDLFDLAENRSPQKTAHVIARVLNKDPESPFYNRLKMLGKKEEGQVNATLSQGTFVSQLLRLISKKV